MWAGGTCLNSKALQKTSYIGTRAIKYLMLYLQQNRGRVDLFFLVIYEKKIPPNVLVIMQN